MAFLEVTGLGRDFPGVTALNDVSLALELGRVHILAGENGAGKSTLVKLITGSDPAPNRGSILVDGQDTQQVEDPFRHVGYVPQELNLFPYLSVAENLFMPFGRSGFSSRLINSSELEKQAQVYLDRFAIEARPSDLVRNISVSDQQLLQIARASTNKDMKVLILDEPTSSLTRTEVDRVFKVVRDFRDSGHAVVFISHKMDEVFAIGDDYTVLRNGEKVASGLIADIEEADLIRAMSGAELSLHDHFRPDVDPAQTEEIILSVEGLTGYRFENISFELKKGEILGFAGLVGAGRSEVMQSMFGFLTSKSGDIKFKGKAWKLGDTSYSVSQGMLYLSEERKHHGILPLLSVRENVAVAMLDKLSGLFGISFSREKSAVFDVIKQYDIKTDSMEKKISFLSGGNQQKAIIGRAMTTRPQLLIFDEPTKGIDVRTKAEIYRIMKTLAEQGVGIILVSSEMDELRKCSNRIITMNSGRITGEFETASTNNETLIRAIFGTEITTNAA